MRARWNTFVGCCGLTMQSFWQVLRYWPFLARVWFRRRHIARMEAELDRLTGRRGEWERIQRIRHPERYLCRES